MNQLAVGQLPDTRHAFVPGVVVLEIVLLQVLSSLALVMGGCKEDADVVLRSLTDQQGVADGSHALVDQGRGRGPQGAVQYGVVQRRQDAVEAAELAHHLMSPRTRGPRSCGADRSASWSTSLTKST